ncbi:hypothetical protein N0V90_004449 [Kalmusia sp. IMI 367209]|nr:hypothetical protein N0V90_004449 [Kalmusia sp. IMI 367209]
MISPRFPQSGAYDETEAMTHDQSALDENTQFSGLERIQIAEEKLQSSLQALRLNVEIAEQLRQHYSSIAIDTNLPVEITSKCSVFQDRDSAAFVGR